MAARARLQKIIDQARITFGKNNPSKDPLYKENLEKLKQTVSFCHTFCVTVYSLTANV